MASVLTLAPGCKVVTLKSALPEDEFKLYWDAAIKVPRKSGPGAFGHMKPRRELCYRTDDDPAKYKYSGKKHETVLYPAHAQRAIDILYRKFCEAVPGNEFTHQSLGVDIVYDDAIPFGGSIGAHSDDEMDWGLVLIYSIGQTRTLRIRNKATKEWTNIPMTDNSLIAMYGADFQRQFTHQVDKLRPDVKVGTRYSLNVRYLSSPDREPKRRRAGM
jgi:alkylated DNA repair dioxygenase AlkB